MSLRVLPSRMALGGAAPFTLITIATLSACDDPAAEPLAAPIVDCASEHPMVGASAAFETHFHEVAGRATVVDDCTIQLTDFVFDGQGLDVRVVLSNDADFDTFDVISDNLLGSGRYDGQTLDLPLREGMTLDHVGYVSIWCVPAGVSFGDGAFSSP